MTGLGRSSIALRYGLVLAMMAMLSAAALATNRAAASATEQVEMIASELRCPVCQGLSVADSPSSTAQEIRRQIKELLDDGLTADAIKNHFAARYGDWILLSPRPQVAWLLPPLVVVVGIVGLSLWLWRRPPTRTARDAEGVRARAPLRGRVRREVREIDA